MHGHTSGMLGKAEKSSTKFLHRTSPGKVSSVIVDDGVRRGLRSRAFEAMALLMLLSFAAMLVSAILVF